MTRAKLIEKILKLDGKRTQGEWKWSDRRNGWSNTALASLDAGDFEVCNFGDERTYYPTEGSEPCENDKQFIALAPDMARIIRDFQKREAMLVEALEIAVRYVPEAVRNQNGSGYPTICKTLTRIKSGEWLD